ncbi:DMT family transporter [Kocuria rosea]|uniref:QacE family quaternary ammonium compound efflux SMR transporter n=1 Tax=Kocuria rosea TaxID=1275 RepID=A0A4R5YGV4_KOCRO|nr:SMR family transporter [Kocuria rosea]TDL42533.1 QacE family quaternary ammonium compound efflux SMR transporter [Kocuria rosea]
MLRRLLLLAAVLAEVAATLSLKAALDEPAWYVLVVTGYLAAFTLLAAVLRRGMPVGVAYGVWAALGVMLTALAAAVVYGERLSPAVLAGIVLVVAGVLCVELGSRRPARSSVDGRAPETGEAA